MKIQTVRFCAIAASAVFASSLTLQPSIEPSDIQLSIGAEASAKSSGGRSGGGSFKSSPSRSSGSSGSSSPSRSNNSPSNNPGNNSPGYNPGYGGPVIVPVPVGGGGYYNNGQPQTANGQPQAASSPASTGELVLGFIILGAGAALVVLVIYFIIKAISSAVKGGGSKQERELNNDIVTVSKIQVALLAQARSIQTELTQLALQVDSDTPEGLQQLLQESALALLRTPENWSHVLSSSESVKNRAQAEEVFSKLSVSERTKFNVESLVNVGGRVTQRDLKIDPEEDPASYIVVTLLVGTAHDKPLFETIRTEEALKAALEKLAALPAEYLMVFELLWSPQDGADSLTYDELLTEYTEMVQI
ncbi:MAG TPA: DUF1517 domain-containing protein [Thermosynechococcaceae cyanobacterium]